jgi:hypothetical protein
MELSSAGTYHASVVFLGSSILYAALDRDQGAALYTCSFPPVRIMILRVQSSKLSDEDEVDRPNNVCLPDVDVCDESVSVYPWFCGTG